MVNCDKWTSEHWSMNEDCESRIKPRKGKVDEKYLEIYQQTQGLAMILANLDGFEGTHEITGESLGRAAGWWNSAVIIQEFMNGHEMRDIIEEVEV